MDDRFKDALAAYQMVIETTIDTLYKRTFRDAAEQAMRMVYCDAKADD